MVPDQIVKGIDGLDLTLVHPNDTVAAIENPKLMCGKDTALVF